MKIFPNFCPAFATHPGGLKPLDQLHSGGGFQFRNRLRPALHFDGGHPQSARGFQISAEVVEINACVRRYAERLAHHQVDARIGFADSYLRRLDHRVEQFHDLARINRAAGGDGEAASAGMLLVMQPVLNLVLMRRNASIISGRKSPASSATTSRPGIS